MRTLKKMTPLLLLLPGDDELAVPPGSHRGPPPRSWCVAREGGADHVGRDGVRGAGADLPDHLLHFRGHLHYLPGHSSQTSP